MLLTFADAIKDFPNQSLRNFAISRGHMDGHMGVPRQIRQALSLGFCRILRCCICVAIRVVKKETKKEVTGVIVCKGVMPAFEEDFKKLKNIKRL